MNKVKPQPWITLGYGDSDTSGAQLMDKEWIAIKANANEKIPLIKCLRAATGMGLREAKDGVEQNCCGPDGSFNVDKTLAYFGQFINFGPEPKMKTPEQVKSDSVIRGIRCAMKNWSVLGFRSEYHACNTVIQNILGRPHLLNDN